MTEPKGRMLSYVTEEQTETVLTQCSLMKTNKNTGVNMCVSSGAATFKPTAHIRVCMAVIMVSAFFEIQTCSKASGKDVIVLAGEVKLRVCLRCRSLPHYLHDPPPPPPLPASPLDTTCPKALWMMVNQKEQASRGRRCSYEFVFQHKPSPCRACQSPGPV